MTATALLKVVQEQLNLERCLLPLTYAQTFQISFSGAVPLLTLYAYLLLHGNVLVPTC